MGKIIIIISFIIGLFFIGVLVSRIDNIVLGYIIFSIIGAIIGIIMGCFIYYALESDYEYENSYIVLFIVCLCVIPVIAGAIAFYELVFNIPGK